MQSTKFSKLIIQSLNKKFKRMLLELSKKNRLILDLNKNIFYFTLNHRETNILFNFLKNFSNEFLMKRNKSSFFKKSNQLFLLDSVEEGNSLNDESKLPTVKKLSRLATYDKAKEKTKKKQREKRPGKKYNFPSKKFHLAQPIYRRWNYKRSLKKNFIIRNFVSFDNKMLIPFLYSNKKVRRVPKSISLYVKNNLLFFFLYSNIIFNTGLVYIFLYKTFFLINAYNSSSLFKQ